MLLASPCQYQSCCYVADAALTIFVNCFGTGGPAVEASGLVSGLAAVGRDAATTLPTDAARN
eukprot:scaffold337901_cov18-Prasinocladus_malaysianus.AAC.1